METKNTYVSFQEWKEDYFEVENTKIGLKGIKETLEEREN